MKKSIRNILALSLAAAAALTAAACGASGSPAAETEAVPAAETVSFTASDYSAVDYSGVMTLGEHSGLEHALRTLRELPELGFVHFDTSDVVRHSLLEKIINAYAERPAERK